MKQFASLLLMVFYASIVSTLNAQTGSDFQLNVSYSYGNIQLLPSLVNNSQLEYDNDKMYSDIWIKGDFQISDKIAFSGALELTDQSHDLIGTKFSRPDYPLSTGRFQQSVVTYIGKNLTIKIGRDDMVSSELRPQVFTFPLFADGIRWNYSWQGWEFEHVYQTLPAERHSDQIYRRSVSYHHLGKTINGLTFGAGEYFILTGESAQFDLKRLNPFLPYSLNSHDSEEDYFSGFSGDSDNSLIKLFLSWQKNSNKVRINLYIDEFQIDGVDRDVYSDAMLLSLSAENETKLFNKWISSNWGFSIANPNFGQHPGPFTTTTSANFPLFEYSPGMTHLIFLNTTVALNQRFEGFLGGYSERWVDISQIPPALRNSRNKLEELKINSDSRVSVGLKYKMGKLPINFRATGWSGSDPGISLRIQYELNHLTKP